MFKLMSKNGKIIADNIPNILLARRLAGAFGGVYITDKNNGVISYHTIEDYYKKAIYDLVLTGAVIQFGKLSICCLTDYSKSVVDGIRGVIYQVEYNDYKNDYSKLFKSAKEAVDKFVELEVKYGK